MLSIIPQVQCSYVCIQLCSVLSFCKVKKQQANSEVSWCGYTSCVPMGIPHIVIQLQNNLGGHLLKFLLKAGPQLPSDIRSLRAPSVRVLPVSRDGDFAALLGILHFTTLAVNSFFHLIFSQNFHHCNLHWLILNQYFL